MCIPHSYPFLHYGSSAWKTWQRYRYFLKLQTKLQIYPVSSLKNALNCLINPYKSRKSQIIPGHPLPRRHGRANFPAPGEGRKTPLPRADARIGEGLPVKSPGTSREKGQGGQQKALPLFQVCGKAGFSRRQGKPATVAKALPQCGQSKKEPGQACWKRLAPERLWIAPQNGAN